jgi:hypothetical protein
MEENLLPSGFVHGVTKYRDDDPSQPHSRILTPVYFDRDPQKVLAVVDTGAPWCILSPDDAAAAGIDYQVEGESGNVMIIRGSTVNGWLCFGIPVHIEAAKGRGITVPSTVFIPELEPGQIWDLPNFLGLSGFLERIRFAVDPGNNMFYFGALEE